MITWKRERPGEYHSADEMFSIYREWFYDPPPKGYMWKLWRTPLDQTVGINEGLYDTLKEAKQAAEELASGIRGRCLWCGDVGHLDRELRGYCSAECYRHGYEDIHTG